MNIRTYLGKYIFMFVFEGVGMCHTNCGGEIYIIYIERDCDNDVRLGSH